jgi:WD40 repeat protein
LAAALEPFCGTRPPVAIPLGATVAYRPEDQSHQNTQTEAPTVARPKPVGVPMAQARWIKQLSDRRSLAGIGSGLLLLLIVLLIVLWPRNSRLERPDVDPISATWPLDRLTPGRFQLLKEFDGTPPKALVLTLRHNAPVNLVALSHDGHYAVSAAADKMLRLWDLASDPPGHEERRFGEYRGAPIDLIEMRAELTDAVRFSSDGRRVLSVGKIDQQPGWRASLWDVATGTELNRTEDVIGDAIFSSDGVTPLVVRVRPEKDKLELYDFVSSREVQPPVPAVGMWWPSLSPNERHLAGQTGASGKGVALCEVVPSRHIATFELDSGAVASRVVFSRDGKYLLWGCSDGLVRRWDVDSAASQPAIVFSILSTKAVVSVAFSRDGGMIAASSIDGKVTVWDAKTRSSLREWTMPDAVKCVTFDAKGRHLATANANGTIFILRLPE